MYDLKQRDLPVWVEDTYGGRDDARFVRYSLNGREHGVLVAEQNPEQDLGTVSIDRNKK